VCGRGQLRYPGYVRSRQDGTFVKGVSCHLLAAALAFPYAETMEVHFAPELQAKIDQWMAETGRSVDELVEDAMAIYMTELSDTREMLNSRYDDLKSGKVKPIPADEVARRLREKSAARRSTPVK
jgi:hypothetical protein